MPIDEIQEELKPYDCTEERPLRDKHDKIVRHNDGSIKFVPNGTVVLTFERETLPRSVNLHWMSLEVTQHEPEPLLCKNCFLYGHTKKKCPSTSVGICGWCSEKAHENTGQRCVNSPKCRHCATEDDHANFSRKCPMWIREKEIAYIRETQKTSYWRAKNIVDGRVEKPYKDKAVKNIHSVPEYLATPNSNIDDKLNQLLDASNKVWEERLTKLAGAVESWETRFEQLVSVMEKRETKFDQLVSLVENLQIAVSKIQSSAAVYSCSTSTPDYLAALPNVDNFPKPQRLGYGSLPPEQWEELIDSANQNVGIKRAKHNNNKQSKGK